jgi:HEAT repeat protein
MFGLDRGELARALPVTGAYSLVLASLYALKPARNALFLAEIGVDQLPYVLVIVALVGGVTASVYGRYASSLRTDRLITRTYVVLMGMLIGFRFLIPIGGAWIFYAFYVWVALYGLLSTSLIWLLANAVFTPREARRAFGLIGTGGIAGAIVGGLVTGQIARRIGTEDLLLVSVGLLVVVLGLLRLVPVVEPPEKRKRHEDVGLRAILESKLLRSLTLTTALIAVIAVIVDIQFNEIVDRSFTDKDAKTAFFGEFFAHLSAFGFLFQLVATPWILRSLGVGVAIQVLPVAMGLGSAAIVFLPSLLTAMLAKGADGSFRHSVHKSGSEVLFLPIPAAVKKRTKLFLDTTVDTTATGVGAIIVLVLTGLGVEYRLLSVVTVGLTALVFWSARQLRGAYVDAFRRALETERIDLSEARIDVTEAGAISAILPALESPNERQVLYILDLLANARSKLLVAPLGRLLSHGSPEVRRRALVALAYQGGGIEGALEHEVRSLLDDPEPRVRLEAMALVSGASAHPEALLAGYLESPERLSEVLGCIARLPSPRVKRLLSPALVERVASSGDESLRALVARAVGTSGSEELRPFLDGLMRDPAPAVVSAALEGIGEARDHRYIPALLAAIAGKHTKRAARAALARFGGDIVEILGQSLSDPATDVASKRTIPRILGEIGEQSAVDLLLAHLDADDPVVRAAVARALTRLRVAHPKLQIDRNRIAEAVLVETRKYYHLVQILEVLGSEERPSARLLRKAVEEKRRRVIERIFVLLGLRYRPEDMESAYHGFVSSEARLRSSALEFLDNLLRQNLRGHILPLLEPSEDGAVVQAGRPLFGDPIDRRSQALAYLIGGDDAWLRACALFDLPHSGEDRLGEHLDTASKDPDPIVRETAGMLRAAHC